MRGPVRDMLEVVMRTVSRGRTLRRALDELRLARPSLRLALALQRVEEVVPRARLELTPHLEFHEDLLEGVVDLFEDRHDRRFVVRLRALFVVVRQLVGLFAGFAGLLGGLFSCGAALGLLGLLDEAV